MFTLQRVVAVHDSNGIFTLVFHAPLEVEPETWPLASDERVMVVIEDDGEG